MDVIEAVRDAAVESGIPWTDDFNRGDNEGVSRFEVNQKSGVRWNASKAFLRPAMKRPNLTVLTGALVKKLRTEGRRVTGVEFFQGREAVYAEARCETILSAGAVGSPQILQLSGIGPGALLQRHGIPVVHELPVGENLQDHLQLRMAFKVKSAETLNTVLSSWWGKAKIALEYALFRTGPMTMPPSQLGAFAKSSPSHTTPNVEYHIQPLSLDKFGDPPLGDCSARGSAVALSRRLRRACATCARLHAAICASPRQTRVPTRRSSAITYPRPRTAQSRWNRFASRAAS